MPNLEIGKLTLRMSGLNSHQAAQLAQRIANNLAAMSLPDAGARYVESLRVELVSEPRGNADRVAQQVAEALVRELERTI